MGILDKLRTMNKVSANILLRGDSVNNVVLTRIGEMGYRITLCHTPTRHYTVVSG